MLSFRSVTMTVYILSILIPSSSGGVGTFRCNLSFLRNILNGHDTIHYTVSDPTTKLLPYLRGLPPSSDSVNEKRSGENGKKNNVARWIYKGRLSNPITGATICGVEGVEVVRSISLSCLESKTEDENEDENESAHKVNSACVGAKKILSSFLSPIVNRVYLSRKIFAYTDPSGSVLQSYQHVPGGKVRKLGEGDGWVGWEGVSGYFDRGRGGEGKGAMVTVFGDGSYVIGKIDYGVSGGGDGNDQDVIPPVTATASATATTTSSSDNNENINLSVFSRFYPPFSASKAGSKVREILAEQRGDDVRGEGRRKLIMFGKDRKHKFGARERYVFFRKGEDQGEGRGGRRWRRIRKEKNLVEYSRLGECPGWYGPNRMCLLELEGRRVDCDEGSRNGKRSEFREWLPKSVVGILRSRKGLDGPKTFSGEFFLENDCDDDIVETFGKWNVKEKTGRKERWRVFDGRNFVGRNLRRIGQVVREVI